MPEAVSFRGNPAVRALAVTSAQRVPAWPELSAIAEFLPGYEAVSWNALAVPARTPAAAIARLNTAMNEAIAAEPVREAFRRIGAEPAEPNTPAQFAAFARVEAQKWVPLVRSLNIAPE